MLETLKSIETVERTAQALRRKYGPDAEAWCDNALRELPRRDPRWGAMRQLRRAALALGRDPGRAAVLTNRRAPGGES